MNTAMPRNECVPWRCPPATVSTASDTHSLTGGSECANVPLWWSASGRSAAPAHTTAPVMTPTDDTGCQPRANGAVDVTAIHAAAPVAAWLAPIMAAHLLSSGPRAVRRRREVCPERPEPYPVPPTVPVGRPQGREFSRRRGEKCAKRPDFSLGRSPESDPPSPDGEAKAASCAEGARGRTGAGLRGERASSSAVRKGLQAGYPGGARVSAGDSWTNSRNEVVRFGKGAYGLPRSTTFRCVGHPT